MPTLDLNHPVYWVFWQLAGFAAAAVYCSFFEWVLHRFVMHRRQPFLPFPYELHAVSHHGLFGADETYHAQDEHMKEHVTFVFRDYVLLTLANLPVYLGAELLLGAPIAAGCLLATLAYLQAFNSLHWAWHVPSDTWLQRTRLFRWMKERHRLHHGRPDNNFNLVLPIADLVFRTFRSPS